MRRKCLKRMPFSTDDFEVRGPVLEADLVAAVPFWCVDAMFKGFETNVYRGLQEARGSENSRERVGIK